MGFEVRDSQQRLPITVIILTKNESETITGAITCALEDYAEIVVLDSFSTDGTADLSRAAGARVVQYAFKGYASQRNYALQNIKLSTEWVFFLDADERISPELTTELRREFARLSQSAGMLYMRRKDMYEGRWIKRSSGYPTWFGRICHATSVEVEREINEEYHCTRPTARLKGHLIHFPFAKGMSQWLARHNSYSTAEAETMAKGETSAMNLWFSRDPSLRRKGLKRVYMRLPLRPLIGFLYLYVIRGGFLDGRSGLRYSMLRAFYELMISIKLDEIRAAQKVGEDKTTGIN